MGRIVVGIDGSAHAQAALRWAVSEAALRGDRVEAVMVWHEPYAGGSWTIPIPFDLSSIEESYRARLDEIVEAADAAGLSEPIVRVLVRGGAAASLLEAADGADLLVVGSRGHGGFLGLVLGSVSQQAASHAPCPVVIVRDPDEAAE